MIGVGGIRPPRGSSGNTDGFRTHGDRDFGSCVASSDANSSNSAMICRMLRIGSSHDRVAASPTTPCLYVQFKIVRIRSSPPRRATRDGDGSSSTLIDAYVVFSRCGIPGGNVLYSR
jgi:hypothetical protein